MLILLPSLYYHSRPPSDRCPHAYICAASVNCDTSAMPHLGPTLSFYVYVKKNLITRLTMTIPSSPLLPLSVIPLYDLLSLHFRCSCCPTYLLPHFSSAVSARFPFLPYSSYHISATTFSFIPLCLFCSPCHISFHHTCALTQHFSPTVLFSALLSLFCTTCSDIIFLLQDALIFAL